MRSKVPTFRERILAAGAPDDAAVLQRFFKTAPGEYGAGDRFIGVRIPVLRTLVKQHGAAMALPEAVTLMHDPIHEVRMAALFILQAHFQASDVRRQAGIYNLYLRNRGGVNNWDLVDCSAPGIVGAHLLHRDMQPLFKLAASPALWDRRIAMIATLHFIRAGASATTLLLAERLLQDREDLMHKATGWMLREVGKRDPPALLSFLDRHAAAMPRTMLRYAIERLPEPRRKHYLEMKHRQASSCKPHV
jgi:3-methyladenine DNA glycosylase AlkD